MNQNDLALAHAIKIKFGTAPDEPNQHQLSLIKNDINALVRQGIQPNSKDWDRIIERHCPGAGRWKYAGADNSDLVSLLLMATRNN